MTNDNGMTGHMNRVFDRVYDGILGYQNGKSFKSCRVDYTWITMTEEFGSLVVELGDMTRRMEFMTAIELHTLFEKFARMIGAKIKSYRMTKHGVEFVLDTLWVK